MRIRALLATLLFALALFALAPPADAHHRSGHTGGPGAGVDESESDKDDKDEEEKEEKDRGDYGHGGKDEEGGQGAGVAVSLGIIGGSVLLIGALGLKPAGAESAQH